MQLTKQNIDKALEEKRYEAQLLYREGLAKLLATENITIRTTTDLQASFHMKSRVLSIPNWQNLSNELYTAFIVHEVGHALFTPRDIDTYINEEELRVCDETIAKIADELEWRPYSSREFILEMGRYLERKGQGIPSIVHSAIKTETPIFCPAF